MVKRNKLEIIKDILTIIKNNRNSLKITPLIRKSNLSTSRFSSYFNELLRKGLVIETHNEGRKAIRVTEKGQKYIEKYSNIVGFIEEFDL